LGRAVDGEEEALGVSWKTFLLPPLVQTDSCRSIVRLRLLSANMLKHQRIKILIVVTGPDDPDDLGSQSASNSRRCICIPKE
jgi:hypothetical protein